MRGGSIHPLSLFLFGHDCVEKRPVFSLTEIDEQKMTPPVPTPLSRNHAEFVGCLAADGTCLSLEKLSQQGKTGVVCTKSTDHSDFARRPDGREREAITGGEERNEGNAEKENPHRAEQSPASTFLERASPVAGGREGRSMRLRRFQRAQR
jgi:hypothetical protein